MAARYHWLEYIATLRHINITLLMVVITIDIVIGYIYTAMLSLSVIHIIAGHWQGHWLYVNITLSLLSLTCYMVILFKTLELWYTLLLHIPLLLLLR